MKVRKPKIIAASVATAILATTAPMAQAEAPINTQNVTQTATFNPYVQRIFQFFADNDIDVEEHSKNLHPEVQRIVKKYKVNKKTTHVREDSAEPVSIPSSKSQKPAKPSKKKSTTTTQKPQEEEPENWNIVEGAENPANPGGPTYTQHFGERFSSDWGQRTFNWSGFEWSVHGLNGRPQAVHPVTGKRQWIDGVSVNDKGEMVIESAGINGAVEVMMVPSTGYGTYEFTYSADFGKMDPSNVLGIFTYDWREFNRGGGFTEMDFIEISRWNAPHLPKTYGSMTYYPDDLKEAKPGTGIVPDGFDIPSGEQTLTTRAEWRKDYLRVVTTTADGKVLSDVTATERVPRDNAQQVHINLWTSPQEEPFGYQGYRRAHGDKITFHDFNYMP